MMISTETLKNLDSSGIPKSEANSSLSGQ